MISLLPSLLNRATMSSVRPVSSAWVYELIALCTPKVTSDSVVIICSWIGLGEEAGVAVLESPRVALAAQGVLVVADKLYAPAGFATQDQQRIALGGGL